MKENCIDTNIILEIMSPNLVAGSKEEKILHGIFSTGGIISVQTLNELVAVTRKWANKGVPGWDMDKVKTFATSVRSTFTVIPVTDVTHIDALDIMERYRLSWWDSLIVAAAVHHGCPILWSKDMHHGLVVDGVTTIKNPFK
ncbi:PIN domain-containing protein [Gluconacetobacter entanii]|uniref:PIN domain-containing protein n=1 Tax=Gluconacetobacter entanii TaxID=108528 RepID=UPI001C934848|nr:PIN domain-containing protein [Gluconacetobacter entanii]MBY4639777.1 PIN domain-containing protein [Gluconacetobacter entanii]MCW4579493.1 PIN domain-containing protein [Gluconacetobacter entanii]MCW4582854.1 PIN domain-containing protein [Gluconacetobacter entanii]MCW4586294.1 PIN domain-containing protein [Gluconacetobacter entanii]